MKHTVVFEDSSITLEKYQTSFAWHPNQMPTHSLHFPSSNQNAVQHMNIHSRLLKREADIETELSLGAMGGPSINKGLVVIGLEFVPFCQDDDSMCTITSLLCTLGEDQLIPWRIMAVQWSTTSAECTRVIDMIVRLYQRCIFVPYVGITEPRNKYSVAALKSYLVDLRNIPEDL